MWGFLPLASVARVAAFLADAPPVALAQLVAAVAWGAVTVRYAWPVLLLFRRRGEVDDAFRAIVGFVGLTQIGFTVRWFVYPHTVPAMGHNELSLWMALYTASTIEAVALVAFSLARARVMPRAKRDG